MSKGVVVKAAREQCANWNAGLCLGVIFRCPDSGEIRQALSKEATGGEDGRCALTRGERCQYFERIVLPAARHEQGMGELDPAYSKMTAQALAEEAGGVRLCACGEVLKPRQRFCAKCLRQRQKAANRAHMRNKRTALTKGA